MRFSSLVAFCAAAFISANAAAETIKLTVPELPSNGSAYYIDLLQTALTEAGHTVEISAVKDVPQQRQLAMVESGELTLTWLVRSAERDSKFVPVEVGITNGLIGQRVLFVKPGTEGDYASVNSLEDFKALGKTGGFGKNWFDVAVWKANDLGFFEQDGDWKVLYKKIAAERDAQYFSRGVHEIVGESAANPELAIEPRLLLVYDRDLRFYISPKHAEMKPIIEDAVQKAKDSGTLQKLIDKHFAADFEKLDYQNRVRIDLVTP